MNSISAETLLARVVGKAPFSMSLVWTSNELIRSGSVYVNHTIMPAQSSALVVLSWSSRGNLEVGDRYINATPGVCLVSCHCSRSLDILIKMGRLSA